MATQELKGNPAEGLAGATLGFFFGFAAVAVFGPAADRLREMMDLTPVMVGFLVAIPTLSGSLLRIPFSAWVDTTGGRKPFLVLLILSIIGMAGLWLLIQFFYPDRLTIEYYPLLLFLGVLSGCGIATFSVGISQVAYWYPQKRRGFALGTFAGLGNLAPGLFSFILPLALAAWGLANAYLAWLGFLLIGTILYAVMGRNAWYFQYRDQGVAPDQAREKAKGQGQELFPSGNAMEALSNSAKIWQTWALVGLYFTTFGGFLALTSWLPTYWNQYFDSGLAMAGTLTAAFSLLASAIRVPGGHWADRLGGEKTAALALTTLLIGALVMTFTAHYAIAIIGSLLIGVGMGINNAAVFKMVPHYVHRGVGGAAGWVGGLGAFGGFAVPPIMGVFVNVQGDTGYATGFIVFVGLALISLLLAGILRMTYHPVEAGAH